MKMPLKPVYIGSIDEKYRLGKYLVPNNEEDIIGTNALWTLNTMFRMQIAEYCVQGKKYEKNRNVSKFKDL